MFSLIFYSSNPNVEVKAKFFKDDVELVRNLKIEIFRQIVGELVLIKEENENKILEILDGQSKNQQVDSETSLFASGFESFDFLMKQLRMGHQASINLSTLKSKGFSYSWALVEVPKEI